MDKIKPEDIKFAENINRFPQLQTYFERETGKKLLTIQSKMNYENNDYNPTE